MKDKILYHKDALNLIEQMQKPFEGTLSRANSPLDAIKSSISPHGKGYSIDFTYDWDKARDKRLRIGKYFRRIWLQTESHTFMLQNIYLRQHAPPTYSGNISFFYTKGYSLKAKYYYRLIIPLVEELKFHYQIEESHFTSDLGYRSRTGTRAIINNEALLINVLSDKSNKKYYLSIESSEKQAFESFSNKAFAITNALGYITGHYAGNNGFFLAYNKKEMKDYTHFHFSEFRNSIQSGYSPIHSNPYGYLSDKRTIAERYYKQNILRPLRIAEFSKLCQKLHDSGDFTASILLILESSISSLLIMPGGFAIALETLSDIIIGADKPKLAPIKDKKQRDLVRKKCAEIIKENCSDIDPGDLNVLLTRIELLNQPTNKARLKAPFEKLGINLLSEDLKILNTRNDFLHGRVPNLSQTNLDRRSSEISVELFYVSMRFYVILNILILKWVGYDNYVVNYPKLHEKYNGIKLKEPYYRKV